jgi:hypothetical protein
MQGMRLQTQTPRADHPAPVEGDLWESKAEHPPPGQANVEKHAREDHEAKVIAMRRFLIFFVSVYQVEYDSFVVRRWQSPRAVLCGGGV